MSDELPPLDSDVTALLRAARAPAPSAELRARAFERLAASAGAAAGGVAAGTGAAGAAGAVTGGLKLGLVAAAALGLGGLGGYAVGVRQAAPAPAPIVITIVAPPLAPAPPEEKAPEPAAEPAKAPTPIAEPRRDHRLAEERKLIEMARSALARHDTSGGLEALERHRSGHPDGKLNEEREALMVQALVESGRRAEAVERARAFRVQFPNSMFLPAVEAMVAPSPP